MKKFFILIVVCSTIWSGFSQTPIPTCFRITLTDKNNSPYSISNPSEYLSQRAINKRNRFHIPITEQDFPINPVYKQQINNINSDIIILSESKWQNSLVIYCTNNNDLQTVQNLPFVSDVLPVANYQLNKSFHHDKVLIPDNSPSSYNLLRNPTYNYGGSYGQIAIHNGHEMHNHGFQGDSMLIAVLDAGWSGFDYINYFQPLFENGQIWGTRDLMPGSDYVYSAHSHGTAVTSILASQVDGQIIGSAPHANYFFIRSENPNSEQLIEEDFWAQAAEIADSIGADVINSSLGYSRFSEFPEGDFTYASCDGVTSIASRNATIAGQKGIVVCISAGNEGSSEWMYISHPSDAFDVLCVGAVNADSIYAPFSSIGPSSDGRVKPDVVSVGWDTWFISSEGDISIGNGTSFSGPVLSGMAACLWQSLPTKTSNEIMQIIRESSHQYQHPDVYLGYGIPNIYQAYLDHVDDPDDSGIPSHKLNMSPVVIFPNPCRDDINIINNDHSYQQIQLYDISGKMVFSAACNSQPILHFSVASLPSGIYFGHVLGDHVDNIFKIVKQ